MAYGRQRWTFICATLSLYSGCCRSSVPGNPVALVAYPVVIRFHHSRRPCGEGCVYR
ncbi:hypothetical protein BHM03_00043466 [Ensete ventricosum]|nr:hypothetical protein BHM03_00043466 [Ensete ventricosum]